jgi:hypothetical protein
MVHVHVPETFSLVGMALGVILVPTAVIGTLFLIVRAIIGV